MEIGVGGYILGRTAEKVNLRRQEFRRVRCAHRIFLFCSYASELDNTATPIRRIKTFGDIFVEG